jgi:hypothetical protein
MKDCVQRHDVTPAGIDAGSRADLRFIGKIVAGIIAVHALAYLAVVLT